MRKTNRSDLADACYAVLDTVFFKALCEPVRIQLVRRLIELGASDVGEIANKMPQDRSVISRHLQELDRAGITFSQKVGRRVVYDLNGPSILARVEAIAQALKPLVPQCCPGPPK